MPLISSIDGADLLHFFSGENELLQLTIDVLPVPIFYKDTHGVYLGCNRAFEEFIKIERQQLVGRNVYELFDKDLADVYQKADIELFNHPGIQVYEKKIRTFEGNDIFVKFHKTSFNDGQGNVAGLIGVIFDITEQKALEEKLLNKAAYDELTGLYNRCQGYAVAEKLLSQIEEDQQVAIIMIDIDHFKRINDTFGHLSGDEALRHIASTFQTHKHDSGIIIRWGGEEFLILVKLSDASHCVDNMAAIAEHYRSVIENHPLPMYSGKVTITISGGVSCYTGQTLLEMINEADNLLYKAKSLGKNQMCVR
ncbi:GGDEF domain-containing protein [Vibrio aestuarianus]|uniref:diguanylate cyclase n=1 Tax=Vibrio aestuarianus TaxID=28171 RepID=A0A9X4FF07_9VIBR|nr:GGDEF domain-containing protein [Vibrio aestuarianus]MDE1235063.1 diguanylate cyclase [Vibrio aestuarianus]MDE1246144.1 diguanylate cyclase [Vibrio aestuarianus]MDE1347257.1 diguanylate cyclase [Vibrio aestuarianus]NGZ64448.1 diguanylate cyclase [Vibrio aestuarianus subsp. cardii]